MANRIVKIEDICHVVKGETGIMKAIPGEFPMVVLSEERKTHNEYQFDCKAVIIPLVSSTGHGHASMKRIHYQEGKFALGSILCALIPKKEGEYDPEYLYHILDMGKERIFVPLMKGMANVSLPMNRIKSVEINLPPYDEQVRLSKIYTEVTKNVDILGNQKDKQQKYLKQLRQSILLMAIQGKLTAKWREENPNVEAANVLLEKIIAKKEQLIKEGKIRREKPLPKISDAEKIFELPDGWVWSKLGEFTQFLSGNNFKSTDFKKGSGAKCIKITNAGVSKLIETDDVLPSEFVELYPSYLIYENDLILALTRPYIADGLKISKCPKSYNRSLLNQRVAAIRVYSQFSQDYIYEFLRSSIVLDKYKSMFAGKIQQPNLKKEDVTHLTVPIPPFEEQKEIVSKVNQLMSWCDELEQKIEKRDSYQKRIIQAVVKQAFTTIKV